MEKSDRLELLRYTVAQGWDISGIWLKWLDRYKGQLEGSHLWFKPREPSGTPITDSLVHKVSVSQLNELAAAQDKIYWKIINGNRDSLSDKDIYDTLTAFTIPCWNYLALYEFERIHKAMRARPTTGHDTKLGKLDHKIIIFEGDKTVPYKGTQVTTKMWLREWKAFYYQTVHLQNLANIVQKKSRGISNPFAHSAFDMPEGAGNFGSLDARSLHTKPFQPHFPLGKREPPRRELNGF